MGSVPPPVIAGQLPGTSTGDSANAGNVGEYLFAAVSAGGAMALTSGSPLTLTSLTLTPGDWDVWLQIYFVAASGTLVSSSAAAYSGSAGGLSLGPTNGTTISPASYTGNGTAQLAFATPFRRVPLSASTTVYAVAQSTFSNGGCTAYGSIQARRRR